jgi:hypothetical protein
MAGEAIIIAASQPAYLAFFLAATQLVVFLAAARWLRVDRMLNGALHNGRLADGQAFCHG